MYFFFALSVARRVLHCRRHISDPLSVLVRRTSTSSTHPFPFPHSTNPTPHEIFHLPRSASQDEIKTRYYELVKVYYPDVIHGQHGVSPSVRNARFRAITHAYGVLRDRSSLNAKANMGAWDHHDTLDEAIRAELRRRARRSRLASATTATDNMLHESMGDTQLWYGLMTFVLVGIAVTLGSVSSHMDRVERHTQSAAANLAQARAEAQMYGMERRRKIREHVRSFHDARKMADDDGRPRMDNTSKVRQYERLRSKNE